MLITDLNIFPIFRSVWDISLIEPTDVWVGKTLGQKNVRFVSSRFDERVPHVHKKKVRLIFKQDFFQGTSNDQYF